MRYILSSIVAVFIVLTTSAQTDSMQVKNHKLYINKHLPLYMHLSASPELEAPSVRLKGRYEDKYSNPFYLDTEGKNSIYPNYGVRLIKTNREQYLNRLIYPVYADGLPPHTYYKFRNSTAKYQNGKRCYKAGLTVKLYAVDGLSAVKSIQYSINGGAYKSYSEEIKFETAGEYSIRFYSEDIVGNVEKEKEVTITVI